MARSLTLHVGTPKSGTTYLQSVLVRGRERLEREGVVYPGARHLPRQGFNQQPAIYSMAGSRTGWADDEVRRTAEGYLGHVCDELAAHDGRALVSAESLAFFDVPAARALIDRLGYDPSTVTVVITARDLGRILPSIWQQNTKNGSTQALGPYLESVASLRDVPGTPLWTAFGLPGLVRRWAEVVGGVERVVLVTSSGGASSDELWNRYADAVDVPREIVNAPGPRVRAVDNVSLTMSQAELLRGLNGVLQADGWERDRQQRLRGHLLGIWMNLPSTSGARRPTVPEHLHDAVRGWAEDDVAQLEASGVRIVGTLADLTPKLPGADATGPVHSAPLDDDTLRDVLAVIEHGRSVVSGDRLPQPLLRLARPLLRWRRARASRDALVSASVPTPGGAGLTPDARASAPAMVTLPDDAVTLPDDAVTLPDDAVTLPDEAVTDRS